jgi:hypothetical protein
MFAPLSVPMIFDTLFWTSNTSLWLPATGSEQASGTP